MSFSIEIKTDNAAFDEDKYAEIARILVDLAIKLQHGHPRAGHLWDINGNKVGEYGDA